MYLLILLSWPHESIDWIESLLIKFADEMTRSLENSFGIKNEFNQLEGISALDKLLKQMTSVVFLNSEIVWDTEKSIWQELILNEFNLTKS